MIKRLRDIADYLNDMADEIEEENLDEDDWCSNKMGIDMQIKHLKDIADEMSTKYN